MQAKLVSNSPSLYKPLCGFILLVAGSLTSPFTMADASCDTNLASRVGPRDYFDQKHHSTGRIDIVEKNHLTPEMLRLEKGNTSTISADLHYTLNVIPNHPAALDLASRLDKAMRSFPERYQQEVMQRSVSCYFKRAFLYTPSQPYLHYIFAIHLHRNQAYEQAAEAYARSQQFGFQNAEFSYNYGLTLFELKRYTEAREMVNLAMQQNYPFEALHKKLLDKGY